MFAMFHLGRMDVLPVGDLGVRNGMKLLYGLPVRPCLLRPSCYRLFQQSFQIFTSQAACKMLERTRIKRLISSQMTNSL